MTKKIILITALLLAMVFVFVGCAGESFAFTALTVETMDGPLTSNGGVSVAYKGYTYFINGNVGTYSGENTFGKVEYGAICRVKTASLTGGVFAERDLANDEYPEVEILAPKAVYTTASGCPNSNGIFIFNDRLYYTTPSTVVDREGAVQNTYLDIMSVRLDGTDTQRMYTVEGNAFDMMLAQKGDSVYAVYLNTESLYVATITDAKPVETLVAEHVTLVKYLPETGVAVFVQEIPEEGHEDHDHEATSNSISIYTVGDAESAMMIDGEGPDVSLDAALTVAQLTPNYVYFTIADDPAGRDGLYRVALDARDLVFESERMALKVFGQNLLSSGVIYTNGTEEDIVFYNSKELYVQYFSTSNKTAKNLFYTISAPSFVKAVGDKVFYVTSSTLKYFSVEEMMNGNGDYAREEDNISVGKYVNAVTWLDYDFYADYMLCLSTTSDSEVYLYYTDYNDMESDDKVNYFVGYYVNTATDK